MSSNNTHALHFCCYRINKFNSKKWSKHKAQITGHNARSIPTPNANPLLANEILLGPALNLVPAACQKLINSHHNPKGHKLRSTAIVAVEHLLTVSYGYFLDQKKNRDAAKVHVWSKACVTWLKEQYGDTLVSAVVHLDETVPHIHAITVPLVNGMLHATALYKGKEQLRAYQTSYGEALAHLGISRGIIRSRAKHQDIGKFYAHVQAAIVSPIELPRVDMAKPTWQDRKDPQSYAQNAVDAQRTKDQCEIENLLAPYIAKATQYENLVKERNDLRWQLSVETPLSHDCSLMSVKHAIGQQQDFEPNLDTAHSSISFTGMSWRSIDKKDGNQIQGRGAISLLMHLFKCVAEKAAAWIRDKFGSEQARQSLSIHMHQEAITRMDQIPKFSYKPPVELEESRTDSVHLDKHDINTYLKRNLEESAQVYIAEQGELVFLQIENEEIVGAEILVEGTRKPILDIGSQVGRCFYRVPQSISMSDMDIALCSSGLSALAYRKHFRVPVISILGVYQKEISPDLLDELVAYIKAGKTIHIALDNTKEDRKLALRLKSALEAMLNKIPTNRILILHPRSASPTNSPDRSESWYDLLTNRASKDSSTKHSQLDGPNLSH